MCNLYSCNSERTRLLRHFRVSDNRAAWFEPKAAIFPGNEAPFIRVAEDGSRELQNGNWGFVRRPHGKAPARTGNCRDDQIVVNRFWTPSFRERRCLVPFTSYCEPLNERPAEWCWHRIVDGDDERPLGAFPGIWQTYTGPVRKDGEDVTQTVFAFMTCGPNALETAIAHGRMPVLLNREDQFEQWLYGSEEEALALAKPFPAEGLRIFQRGAARKDLLEAA